MKLSALFIPRTNITANDNTNKGVRGLEFVRGWYEILDVKGTSRGQILMAVYPLAENEENPSTTRLCPRLERLLELDSTVDLQDATFEDSQLYNCKTPLSNCIPALPYVEQDSGSKVSQKPHDSRESEKAAVVVNASSLFTTLQSRMEELDLQNARFKKKLLELSTKLPARATTSMEARSLGRPGKGSKINEYTSQSPQEQQNQEVFLPPPGPKYDPLTDSFQLLCGTGDNNSKIRTASSTSSVASKSNSSNEMFPGEEEDGQDVLLSDGDSMGECEEIEEDNSASNEARQRCSKIGGIERKDLEDKLDKNMDKECKNARPPPLFPVPNSKSSMKKGYNEDPTSIISCSTSSLTSRSALMRGNDLNNTQSKVAPGKMDVPATRREGNDCPSTWSVSSTDVEEYLQRFRKDFVGEPDSPTRILSHSKLVISEEEAESLTSLHTQACIARTVSSGCTVDRRTEADTESVDYDEPTGVDDPLEEDSTSESVTVSPQKTEKLVPKFSEETPWRDANDPVPHCHLQALKLAREAAESVRHQQPTRPNMQSRFLKDEFIEDPIRQRIHANLSSLVRKTITTTGDRLQHSQTTAAAILKSSSQDDPALTSTLSSQSTSSATSIHLSSRSLARAARIFEMKL